MRYLKIALCEVREAQHTLLAIQTALAEAQRGLAEQKLEAERHRLTAERDKLGSEKMEEKCTELVAHMNQLIQVPRYCAAHPSSPTVELRQMAIRHRTGV